MKILALMPDAYRGFAGIAQYNRDLIEALLSSARVDQIVSLTRVERYGVEGKRVLLTFGRLPGHERYKGQDRIIALLPKLTARFRDLVYMIAGDGSDRPRLEAMVSTLSLEEHVVFAGRIREDEKIDHYNLADAFAMPSTSEGFGFVFLEAAACGLPVLGGRNDGSRDALVDGQLGVMVDPESPDELLDGLETILKREKRVPDCLARFDFPRFGRQIEELVATTAYRRPTTTDDDRRRPTTVDRRL